MPSSDTSHLRRRLLHRIHRQYQTITERIDLGGVQLDFTRIADPDRVLDQVAAEEDRREKQSGERHHDQELHLPYWAELWDSAQAVSRFLLAHRAWLPDPPADVLDLGCGMGLTGTVAAAMGARVVFADLEAPALLFAALNSLPFRGQVQTRRLNWRKNDLGRRFDLIIGADILYDRKEWEWLDRFWRGHLKPDGFVLLGEPGRQTGDAFPAWIEPRGWRLERFEQPVSTRPRPVRIFRLLPPSSPRP